MAFLTAYSASLPKNFYYNFNLNGQAIPNIFTLFTGGSTSGKSEILDPFIKPLSKIANKNNNEFYDAQKKYQQVKEAWKYLSKDEKEQLYLQAIKGKSYTNLNAIEKFDVVYPEPVEKHPCIVTDASFESLKKMSGRFKTHGLLIAPREIRDFIDTIVQITRQKNSGLNKLISVWDGETTLRRRITGEREEADTFQVSLLSTIQTEAFRQYFQVNEDETGIVSRFLIVPIEDIYIPTSLEKDTGVEKLTKTFVHLFKTTLEKLEFTELFKVGNQDSLNEWHDWRVQQEEHANLIKNLNKGFYQWLRRNAEYTARIALVIHTLRFVEGLEPQLEIMSVASMKRAVAISKWLTQKAQIVFNQSLNPKAATTNPEENKIFKDLLKYCDGKPTPNSKFGSGHSFVRRADVLEKYGKKGDKWLNKPQVIKMFKDAEKQGLGKCETDKRGVVIFTPNPSLNID